MTLTKDSPRFDPVTVPLTQVEVNEGHALLVKHPGGHSFVLFRNGELKVLPADNVPKGRITIQYEQLEN